MKLFMDNKNEFWPMSVFWLCLKITKNKVRLIFQGMCDAANIIHGKNSFSNNGRIFFHFSKPNKIQIYQGDATKTHVRY